MPDFIVTLRVGQGTQPFVVTAEDDAAVRALLERHHVAGDRRHYRSVSGSGRVDVVWRNVAFPDATITPVPCS